MLGTEPESSGTTLSPGPFIFFYLASSSKSELTNLEMSKQNVEFWLGDLLFQHSGGGRKIRSSKPALLHNEFKANFSCIKLGLIFTPPCQNEEFQNAISNKIVNKELLNGK